MTTTMTTDLELLRTRVTGAIGGQMPGHIERLGWPAGRLAAWQRDRLRTLLARAIERSPFHAARLRGIDPSRFELADLPRLPVMTKAEMMQGFDAVATDRRLTREAVERHLARSVDEPSLLFGGYVCLVSGGSSGRRGLFVQTVEEYAEFAATAVRRAIAAALASGDLPRVLVTNLHNLTQPFIRYELTDRFTPAGYSDGGCLRASIEGRSDDLFRYPEACVHPFVVGAPLLRVPVIREYQVRQTGRGADIAAVVDGDLDQAAVTGAVRDSLRRAGLADPQVVLRRVGALDRDPMTSKARRFIPLAVTRAC